MLKVDPFGQAIGADQDVLLVIPHLLNAGLTFRGWDLPGDGNHRDPFGESLAKLFCQVLGCGNETTEQNRAMPLGDELFDDRHHLNEFGVAVAFELVGCTRHVEQSLPLFGSIRLVLFEVSQVRTRRDVRGICGVFGVIIEDERATDVIDFVR